MKRICFLLFAITMVFLVPQIQGAEWVSYGTTSGGILFSYDKERVIIDGDIVMVWTKLDYVTSEAKERELSGRRKQGLPTEGFESISYELNLLEINCHLQRFGLLRYSTYDDKGMALESGSAEAMAEQEWEDIAPNSKSEILYKIVCDMAKKQSPTQTAPKE